MPFGRIESYERCGCKLCKKILKVIEDRKVDSILKLNDYYKKMENEGN